MNVCCASMWMMRISIGDYVLSGGELAAMVLMDSLVRQLPGVLGDAESAEQVRSCRLLDCRTTPARKCLMVKPCPRVLLSGNHADIQRFGGFSSRWAGRGAQAGFIGQA